MASRNIGRVWRPRRMMSPRRASSNKAMLPHSCAIPTGHLHQVQTQPRVETRTDIAGCSEPSTPVCELCARRPECDAPVHSRRTIPAGNRLEVATAPRSFDENGRADIRHIACCWLGMIVSLAHASFLAPDQQTRSFRRPLDQAQDYKAQAGVTPNQLVARANACSQAVLPVRDAGASLK